MRKTGEQQSRKQNNQNVCQLVNNILATPNATGLKALNSQANLALPERIDRPVQRSLKKICKKQKKNELFVFPLYDCRTRKAATGHATTTGSGRAEKYPALHAIFRLIKFIRL